MRKLNRLQLKLKARNQKFMYDLFIIDPRFKFMMTNSDNTNESSLLKNQLDLAVLVRSQRLKAGQKGGKMTAQTLAELAGVSRDTIFRIERGEDVSFSTAMVVLRVFGLGLSAAPVCWPTLDTAQHHFKAQ